MHVLVHTRNNPPLSNIVIRAAIDISDTGTRALAGAPTQLKLAVSGIGISQKCRLWPSHARNGSLLLSHFAVNCRSTMPGALALLKVNEGSDFDALSEKRTR